MKPNLKKYKRKKSDLVVNGIKKANLKLLETELAIKDLKDKSKLQEDSGFLNQPTLILGLFFKAFPLPPKSTRFLLLILGLGFP
ncbi:hypothetical protein L1887_15671 [Cichorium endivia]|nr:hypothetical protein L1887_15671 [Cichorium endivia]